MATAPALIEAKTPADRVIRFRQQHGLTTEELDRLFGFTSKGRATRRWESEGAPAYVEVAMTYMDKFGLKTAREIATARGA